MNIDRLPSARDDCGGGRRTENWPKRVIASRPTQPTGYAVEVECVTI